VTLEEQKAGSVTILEVAGRIDSASSPSLHERVGALIAQGSMPLLLDLGKVEYISSAGFRVLLLLARQAGKAGGRFALCALTPKVKQLFDLGGFLDLLPIANTREEGIAEAQ
jgi:anti-anti-sigma factor